MKLPIYQIDAFASKPFEGNPAAVVPLETWLPEKTMQAIAEESNLSETAFFVPAGKDFSIRWFTPTSEVKLCGHATLASAFVLFNLLGSEQEVVTFDSLSGPLTVRREGDLLTMDFPAQAPQRCETPEALIKGLGSIPKECFQHDDYVAVFENEEEITAITPGQLHLEQLDLRGVIVTAPSVHYDFVVRCFAPKYGIPEDPVTGSAYTQLTPFWADRLGKAKLTARQISARGGNVFCELQGDRVLISGSAVKFMEGTIEVTDQA